jgi:hypothetical protein
MPDFQIRIINDSEVGISAITEKAQHRIPPGQTIVFKSSGDARPYVAAAEIEEFTFTGKETIGL